LLDTEVASAVYPQSYEGVPYDTTAQKATHKIETAPPIVDLVAGLTLIIVPVLLVLCIWLNAVLLVPLNIVLGVVFSFSCANILQVPYKLRVALVASISTVLTNLLFIAVPESDFSQKILGKITIGLLIMFCLGFISEMLKKDRSMMIKSLATTITLEIFASLFCGFFLVSKLLSGLFAGYVLLILASLVVVGFIYSVVAVIQYFSGRMMSARAHNRLGVLVYLGAVFASYYATLALGNRFFIKASDIAYALIPGVIALCISHAQFSHSRTISGALTRSLFAISTLGIAVYICVVIQ
jgi:hypothetical protein